MHNNPILKKSLIEKPTTFFLLLRFMMLKDKILLPLFKLLILYSLFHWFMFN